MANEFRANENCSDSENYKKEVAQLGIRTHLPLSTCSPSPNMGIASYRQGGVAIHTGRLNLCRVIWAGTVVWFCDINKCDVCDTVLFVFTVFIFALSTFHVHLFSVFLLHKLS